MPCRPPARVAPGALRPRGVVFALLAIAIFGLPAFSAGAADATSDSPPPAVGVPAPRADAKATPDTSTGPEGGEPAAPPRGSASPAAGDPAAAPPPDGPVPIVLVLPLDSAPYGRAAAAVRAGFLAAAQGGGPRTRVLSHADGDPMPAFAEARALGARVVVGPLVRDDLRALAIVDGELPVTLALNQLDEGQVLPPRVYALTLAIEAEGRQLARIVQAQGVQTVAVIGADAPLQKRFAAAFVDEWLLQGGGRPEVLRFDRSLEGLAQLRRALGRIPKDAVLLAVDGPDVALVKSFVGTAPVFTSSQAHDRLQFESQHDLDGLQFVEVPWLADPLDPSVDGLPRNDYPTTSLERLYALGIDAFRVARAFVDGPPASLEIDGATGHLSLGNSRVFRREGRHVRLQGGRLEAAAPR